MIRLVVTQPSEVLLIDDRAENTLTARALGMHATTFASASALDRELRLTVRIPFAA